MQYQLTVVSTRTDAEGMYCQITDDRVPNEGEMFDIRIDDRLVKGTVYKILNILEMYGEADLNNELKLATTIVYVVVSIDDYRYIETALALNPNWHNYDYI